MNFAHLASFRVIEFVDRSVPKMLDILHVRQAKTKLSLQNAAFCSTFVRHLLVIFSSACYILSQTYVFSFRAPLIYFTLNQNIAAIT